MSSKEELDIEKIQYLFIRDISFDYLMPRTPPSKERQSIHYKVNIEKNVSEDDKIIILLFNIELKTLDRNNEEITGNYISEHLFKIENLEEFIKKREDFFEIDDQIDNALTSLAYSTIRGLLYHKFSGTPFSNFILPVTRPADLAGTA